MENRSLAHSRRNSELAACPYSDHRADKGRPANLGALRDLNRSSGPSLDLLSSYCEATPTTEGSRHLPPLSQMWQLASIARSNASRLLVQPLLKGEESIVIDGTIAAVFKISRGLCDLFEYIADRGHCVADVWSVPDLMQFIEANQLLIGRDEVCAAPTVLIERYLKHLFMALKQRNESAWLGRIAEPAAIAKYAGLYSLMERLCFLYATLRLLSIAQMRHLGPCEAVVRPTFSASSEVAKLIDLPLPIVRRTLLRKLQLTWSVQPEGELLFSRSRELADKILSAEGPLAGAVDWQDFITTSLDCVNWTNCALGAQEHFAVPHATTLTLRDMNHFFGPLGSCQRGEQEEAA